MAYTNFTNCTEQEYLDIIYSQDDRNRIRIWFDDIELEDAGEYCEELAGTNRILPNDGNKRFSLSNFVAKEYQLVLRNLPVGTIIKDQVKISIGTLVDEDNNIYEDVPIGIFNIQDTPTTDKDKITIKLRDNRVKFDFPYNAKPLIDNNGGSATKKEILNDICLQAGVENTITSFDGDSDLVAIYDNTILGTIYVSYLLEQAGLIPTIDREGRLIKIDLSNLKTWRIPLSLVENYEIGTSYEIERICYEQGTIKFQTSSDKDLDTLYLDSANMYINRQEQIDTMFSKIGGFQIDSVTTGKILGNPAIDPYDIIEVYDDYDESNPVIFRTLANNTYTYNGIHRNTFDTQIGKEERVENVSKNSDSTFKYSIKNEINALEGSVGSVISQTIDTGNPDSAVNKVSRLTQRVDSLESEISNVTGMVTTKDSTSGSITFTDATNESEPITIKVYPTVDSISYLYPSSNLYPSATTYLKTRKIRFYNETTSQVVYDYVLPDDLLYYDSEHYDEFYLDLNSQTCQITKRCKYNADGTVSLLASEQIISYEYPLITLTEGVYTISLLGYSNGYILTTLMAKNIYTDQFYTKVETDSKISQTAENINLSVNQKLSNYSTTSEMNSAIDVKADEITSSVSKNYASKETTNSLSSRITQNASNISSEVSRATGSESALSTRIGQAATGISLTVNNGSTSSGITIGVTKEDGTTSQQTGTIQMTGLVKFTDLSTSGSTTINGANIQTGTLSADKITTGTLNGITIKGSEFKGTTNDSVKLKIGTDSDGYMQNNNSLELLYSDDSKLLGIYGKYWDSSNDMKVVYFKSLAETFYFLGKIRANNITSTSLESEKKNFEKFNNALEIIKNTDIYKYNLKVETESCKKHIGFVIGDKYNYSKEITTDDNSGVDIYSMISVCFKAIQEQQEIIENLQKRIEKLERESDK